MHSALVVVTVPKDRSDIDKWRMFLANVQAKLQPHKGVLRFAVNVWLVNVHASPAPLGWLISHAEACEYTYGILPFQTAPEWLPGNLDPTTMQD
jgi:hypothetical protein